MNHKTDIHHLLSRLLSFILSALLIIESYSICANAALESGSQKSFENMQLATLLEKPLPIVECTANYIVRYTDNAVGQNASEGDHWVQLDGEALAAALANSTVSYYEEDTTVTLLEDSNTQWEHGMIHLEAMDQIGADGTGVVIGIIDSGVYPHEGLKHSLLPGYNYIDNNEDTSDTYGHGTKVAGILAATCSNNSTSGVAQGAKLVPLKAFNEKEASISNLVSAIYDAVDTFHCDIINMSFGTTIASDALEYAINYAASQGIIMTAAVGNDGATKLQYPAGYDAVIGVGSVNQDSSHAASSQRNASVYISAPGVMVSTTTMDGSYDTVSGTSFATPMVTGSIADLLSMKPDLTSDEIRSLLADSAIDAGADGYDTSYGWGIVNLKAARDLLLCDTTLYLNPLSIGFDGTLTADITRLSGSRNDISLITTVNKTDGSLVAASTMDLTLNHDGKLTTSFSIPSTIADYTLLSKNLAPMSSQTLTLSDGNTVNCYVIRTGTRFRDITWGQYCFDSVHWAAENYITYGIGKNLFAPENTCTRAQIVTFLWRLNGCPETINHSISFVDVPEGCYYETALCWAVENDITFGTDESHFSPNQICNRAQIVLFLWRAAGCPESTAEKSYTDVPDDCYYEQAVLWAVENGIVYGTDATHFSPTRACTRGQAVTMLFRYAAA